MVVFFNLFLFPRRSETPIGGDDSISRAYSRYFTLYVVDEPDPEAEPQKPQEKPFKL